MENNPPRQQAIERLKQASSVLVTVSSNPSVDQLAACIGLTLMLNKIGKHGTAVYSGKTPSIIEFLKPEQTLEKNTDSLRDFIIALDKSKADKLRYKVEDKVVRIFITPYRTSLSEKDLEFSLGDFNVDAVVALGVRQQTDLDQAIMAHGRILHDATVISLNTTKNNNLGSINWQDEAVSSLSEMVAGLAGELGKDIKGVFDTQIATALLTGIVAETKRFSNNKTSSQTMSISAQLIAAGANQQLVATKLEPPPPPPPPKPPPPPPQPKPIASDPKDVPKPMAVTPTPPKPPADGTLYIEHNNKPKNAPAAEEEKDLLDPQHQIEIDQEGTLRTLNEKGNSNVEGSSPQPPPGPAAASPPAPGLKVGSGSPFMFEPPSLSGTLTANSGPEILEPPSDPLSRSSGSTSSSDSPQPKADDLLNTNAPDDIIGSQLGKNNSPPDINSARDAVDAAAGNVQTPKPESSSAPAAPPPTEGTEDSAPGIHARHALDMPIPPPPAPPVQNTTTYEDEAPSGAPLPSPSSNDNAAAPPPVPPPLTPPVF